MQRLQHFGSGFGVCAHLAWQIAFYLVALVFLIAISFWTISNYQLTPAFTLDNYYRILGKGRYLEAAEASLKLAVLTAVMAVALAVPVAHTVAFHLRGRLRHLVLFLLFLPFLSSYIVRMFAWQLVLSDQGIVAWIVRASGSAGPVRLLFTETAVVIGLLSILIPIASLMILLSLMRLDKSLIMAARNLGASSWQVFIRIQLPFAMSGILVGLLFCFIITFGDFTCSSILGGNQIYYLSIAIEDRAKINDWPAAAVLGTLLLIISLSVVTILFGCVSRLPAIGGTLSRGHS